MATLSASSSQKARDVIRKAKRFLQINDKPSKVKTIDVLPEVSKAFIDWYDKWNVKSGEANASSLSSLESQKASVESSIKVYEAAIKDVRSGVRIGSASTILGWEREITQKKAVLANITSRIAAIKKSAIKKKRVPKDEHYRKVRDVYHALLRNKKIAHVLINEGYLVVATYKIINHGDGFGKYQLVYGASSYYPKVTNLTYPSDHPHPHISGTTPCLDEWYYPLQKAYLAGDLVETISGMLQFLALTTCRMGTYVNRDDWLSRRNGGGSEDDSDSSSDYED